jgi:hypothetical protein
MGVDNFTSCWGRSTLLNKLWLSNPEFHEKFPLHDLEHLLTRALHAHGSTSPIGHARCSNPPSFWKLGQASLVNSRVLFPDPMDIGLFLRINTNDRRGPSS